MNETVEIERIENRFDQRVLDFCRDVCLENGADESYVGLDLSKDETVDRFRHLPAAAVEEIWKYGRRKWSKTEFDNLECLMCDGRVVGLSGTRSYDSGLLRVCMHLYTLKSFRARAAGMQFTPGGVFSRHLAYARENHKTRAAFMTVFPHTSKLKALAVNLASRKLSGTAKPMIYVRELIAWPTMIEFHDVRQHFFFYPLKPDFEFDGRSPRPASKLQTFLNVTSTSV